MPFRSESEISLIDRPTPDKNIKTGEVIAAWVVAMAMIVAMVVGPSFHAIINDSVHIGFTDVYSSKP